MEMVMRTGPRQRIVFRAMPHGAILETQSVMSDRHSHGWATIVQHHLDRDQAGQMRDWLDLVATSDRDDPTAETVP